MIGACGRIQLRIGRRSPAGVSTLGNKNKREYGNLAYTKLLAHVRRRAQPKFNVLFCGKRNNSKQ